MLWDLFLNSLKYSGVSEDKNGFGAHGHVRKSENHGNERFSGFPKVKSKTYYSKMKQNNSTEL